MLARDALKTFGAISIVLLSAWAAGVAAAAAMTWMAATTAANIVASRQASGVVEG